MKNRQSRRVGTGWRSLSPKETNPESLNLCVDGEVAVMRGRRLPDVTWRYLTLPASCRWISPGGGWFLLHVHILIWFLHVSEQDKDFRQRVCRCDSRAQNMMHLHFLSNSIQILANSEAEGLETSDLFVWLPHVWLRKMKSKNVERVRVHQTTQRWTFAQSHTRKLKDWDTKLIKRRTTHTRFPLRSVKHQKCSLKQIIKFYFLSSQSSTGSTWATENINTGICSADQSGLGPINQTCNFSLRRRIKPGKNTQDRQCADI